MTSAARCFAHRLIALAPLFTLQVGCSEPPAYSEGFEPGDRAPDSQQSAARAGGSGGSGFPDVLPLQVAFDDAAQGLTSDGRGIYVDGVDRVQAILRSNGNLNFDAAALTGKQQPIRLVQVRVTDDNTGAVVFDGLVDLFMSTHPRLADDLVLQQMAVGQTGYTTGSARWPSGNSTYILHYGRTCAGDVVVIENRMAAAHPTEGTWVVSGLRGQLCRQANKTIVTVTDRASAAFQVTLTALSP